MKIAVNVRFELDKDQVYDAKISIPQQLTAEDPFLFNVNQVDAQGKVTGKLVDVAVVDKTKVQVLVAPPQDLMDKVGIGGVVKKLDVVVAEGNYDSEHQKFIETEEKKEEE